MAKDKIILVHLDTNEVNIFRLQTGRLKLLKKKQIFFNETLVTGELLRKLDMVVDMLAEAGNLDNKSVRLYATGIFQEFSKEEQQQLAIYVFVKFGLVFNIIEPKLEEFYLKKSYLYNKTENIIQGLALQEFRKVVVCGSFQEHLAEISRIIKVLTMRNIQVLSPWTDKVVPETLGTDFILLEGQELYNKRDAWRHKYDHMNKFKKADAIIICNPGGAIGKGTMFELGFMIAYSKRIIFSNEPKNLSILFPYEVGLTF